MPIFDQANNYQAKGHLPIKCGALSNDCIYKKYGVNKGRHENLIINVLYNKQFENFCLLYKTL